MREGMLRPRSRVRPRRAGRRAVVTLAVVAVLAGSGCGGASGSAAAAAGETDNAAAAAPARAARPVVEVVPASGPAFLDPDAAPRTELGRLRAQYLPVWTAGFDWAFPPEACDTAWELDGIAEPTSGADLAVLGDSATAAALSVMRYEHQFSRALADPNALSQLCVATAAVGPARTEALGVLESYLETGARRSERPAFPVEVWILGAGPTSVLSVACVTPGYPAVVDADGGGLESAEAPARLQAYLLWVSRGLEDQVADVSYRVSDTAHRAAEDCSDLGAWAAEWDGHLQSWIDQGQVWEPVAAVLTAESICDSPPPDGPDECPRDWPL